MSKISRFHPLFNFPKTFSHHLPILSPYHYQQEEKREAETSRGTKRLSALLARLRASLYDFHPPHHIYHSPARLLSIPPPPLPLSPFPLFPFPPFPFSPFPFSPFPLFPPTLSLPNSRPQILSPCTKNTQQSQGPVGEILIVVPRTLSELPARTRFGVARSPTYEFQRNSRP
jgi:hypothetical protein